MPSGLIAGKSHLVPSNKLGGAVRKQSSQSCLARQDNLEQQEGIHLKCRPELVEESSILKRLEQCQSHRAVFSHSTELVELIFQTLV